MGLTVKTPFRFCSGFCCKLKIICSSKGFYSLLYIFCRSCLLLIVFLSWVPLMDFEWVKAVSSSVKDLLKARSSLSLGSGDIPAIWAECFEYS